jgi:hypothetical protein
VQLTKNLEERLAHRLWTGVAIVCSFN